MIGNSKIRGNSSLEINKKTGTTKSQSVLIPSKDHTSSLQMDPNQIDKPETTDK